LLCDQLNGSHLASSLIMCLLVPISPGLCDDLAAKHKQAHLRTNKQWTNHNWIKCLSGWSQHTNPH